MSSVDITGSKLYSAIAYYRKQKASDVHVIAGRCCYARIHGDLITPVAGPSAEEVSAFLEGVCTPFQLERFKTDCATEAAYSDDGVGRIRVHAEQTQTGTALMIRYLQDHPPAFATLDLPDTLADWMRRPSGLVLFSGVTGSGKTTLQASLMELALQHSNPRILTLEDPIEYKFDHDPRVSQKELGLHFRSFEYALEGFMRADPDIIMMGEIRSVETARSVLLAAESGHLVLATVHSRDTSRVADRILALFPEGERDLVRVQLAQQLVGVAGLKLVKMAPLKDATIPGRRAACELLVNNDAIASMIINGNKAKEIRDAVSTGKYTDGMMTLEGFLSELCMSRKITADTAKEAAEYPEDLRLVAGL